MNLLVIFWIMLFSFAVSLLIVMLLPWLLLGAGAFMLTIVIAAKVTM